MIPGADFLFRADLSSLAGADITLYFDMTSEDDGFQFDPDVPGVSQEPPQPVTPPVPEPSSLVLAVGIGLVCAVGRFARRRQRG